MASLQGLPPLPKSLSGFNLLELAAASSAPANPTSSSFRQSRAGPSHHGQQPLAAPRPRKSTGLDAQLAILRKEMFGLRQLDLSLLSQLWSLNESIQEFRQLLQEQEDSAALSPPSPSSADEGEEFYSPLPRYHAPPGLQLSAVPEQYRLSSSSSQSSIEYGNV
ncbi:leucine repeat adapter protein 25 isoform X2 [Anabrus simplex]